MIPVPIMMWLLKGKSLAGDVIGWIADHPWQSAFAGLAAWMLWVQFFTIPGLEREIEREVAAHQKTKDRYEAAQQESFELHVKELKAQEARYAALAEEADKIEEQANEDAMARARRYIVANRVQCPSGGAVGSTTSSAAAPAAGGDTQRAEEASRVSELVTVPASDILICTANTIRLQTAVRWASDLNPD